MEGCRFHKYKDINWLGLLASPLASEIAFRGYFSNCIIRLFFFSQIKLMFAKYRYICDLSTNIPSLGTYCGIKSLMWYIAFRGILPFFEEDMRCSQGCAENWAPIVDIPNFGSFLPKNWVGVGMGVANFQKLWSRLGLGLQN